MSTTTQGEHSGGNVSYYNLYVSESNHRLPYYIECEDVIATTDMTFAEGTALKSLWRSCAARTLGLLKRGGDSVYDAEKLVYYTKEIIRRASWSFTPETTPGSVPKYDNVAYRIEHPKRNLPCTAYVDDISKALGMTFAESMCLIMLWNIVSCKAEFNGQARADLVSFYGNALLFRAEEVLAYRKLEAAKRGNVNPLPDTSLAEVAKLPQQIYREGHAEEDSFALNQNSGRLVVSSTTTIASMTEVPKQ